MPVLKLLMVGTLSLFFALLPRPADAANLESAQYVLGEIDLGVTLPGDIAYAGTGFFIATGSFGSGTQQIARVTAAGTQTVVATNLNSVAGLFFDPVSGSLFFVDNGGEQVGSTTGDTVYELPNALTASATDASTLEIAPAGSIPFASKLILAESGTLLVTNAAASPGTVELVDIETGNITVVISDLGYAAGIKIGPNGNLFVGDVDASSFAGSVIEYAMDLSVPSFTRVGALIEGAGSFDHAFDRGGNLLLTGGFGPDFTSVVDSVDSAGAATTLSSGFAFSSGISIDPMSGQVGVVDGCFPACTTVTNLTPIAEMTGVGRGRRDCNASLFGGVEEKNARGRGKNRWECTDGDSACDRDGAADGTCTFIVGGCVGLANPANTGCQADLDAIEVRRRPKVASDGSFPALQDNMDAVLGGGPACSEPVVVTVQKAKRTSIRLKARSNGRVVDRDTLVLRCR